MKFSIRSFPHPVLGNRDDVPGAAFQTTINHSQDKDYLYLDISAQCSSSTLTALLASKKAQIVLHIECSNTLFRRCWSFFELSFQHSIPIDEICNAVEVNIVICSCANITDYQIDGAHDDYIGAKFQIQPGDILAIGQGVVLDIIPDFESLGVVSSIMQIHALDSSEKKPVTIDFDHDRIAIFLPRSDFKNYQLARKSPEANQALTCLIVVPVLVEAIRLITEEPDALDLKWQLILSLKINALKKSSGSTDAFTLAQELLELPISRALATTVAELQKQM